MLLGEPNVWLSRSNSAIRAPPRRMLADLHFASNTATNFFSRYCANTYAKLAATTLCAALQFFHATFGSISADLQMMSMAFPGHFRTVRKLA
jgi:hypothetical protein